MLRRDFLKNSIGALLGVALTSNKTLASIVETLTPESPKVLLYLIQTTSGVWKVKATKWIDLYKNKRLKPCEVKKETFQALDIVDYEVATKRKYELWKQYNCSGRLTPVKIIEDTIAGKKSISSENYLKYKNSDKFKENIKKRVDAASVAIRNMDDELRKLRSETARKHITGKKHSEETILKLKTKFKGRPSSMRGKNHSEETKKKISEKAKGRPSFMKGKTLSEEVRSNMSIGAKNRKYTDEGREKRKENSIGEKNNFYGKKHTVESIIKIKEKHPSKIKLTCQYCNKTLDLPNFKRYHGIKCKVLTGVSAVSDKQRKKVSEKLKKIV